MVGGLPKGVEENYVYEYDSKFKFVKKHIVKSGYTLMGIQTAELKDNRFWFGCYGEKLVVTDASLKFVGKHDVDCGLGIVGIGKGRFLIGRGTRVKDKGHTGSVVVGRVDEESGLVIQGKK